MCSVHMQSKTAVSASHSSQEKVATPTCFDISYLIQKSGVTSEAEASWIVLALNGLVAGAVKPFYFRVFSYTYRKGQVLSPRHKSKSYLLCPRVIQHKIVIDIRPNNCLFTGYHLSQWKFPPLLTYVKEMELGSVSIPVEYVWSSRFRRLVL